MSTYSSPIFLISNRPQPVPISSAFSSSVLLQMVAPHALKKKNKTIKLVQGKDGSNSKGYSASQNAR